MPGQDPHGTRGFSKAPRRGRPARRQRSPETAGASGRSSARGEARAGVDSSRQRPLVASPADAGEVRNGTRRASGRYSICDPREPRRRRECPNRRYQARRETAVSRGTCSSRPTPISTRSSQSTADEPARSAGGRRRGRGLVVLAEQYRSPHARRAHDAERFTRLNGNVARWRAAARHALRQADAAAGRLLRDLAARPYRALVDDRCARAAAVRVQLAGARRPRHIHGAGERPTGDWLATPSRSDTSRRGSGLSPPSSARSRRPRASRRRAWRPRGRRTSVPGRRRPSRRPPAATTVIADRHVATATATAITRGDARPRSAATIRSPPRGKHPRQHTNRRAAGRAAARPAGTRRATRPRWLGARSGRRRSLPA